MSLRYFGESDQLICAHPLVLIRIEGRNNSAAAKYIQCHDSPTAPADGTVPNRERQVNPGYFNWEFAVAEQYFGNGLYICLSDTAQTKTLSSDNMDFFVDVDRNPVTFTEVGNLTSAVANLEVWDEAAGPKKLVKVECLQASGEERFLWVYADDNYGVPVMVLGPIASGSTKRVFEFGLSGRGIAGLESNGTLVQACQIVVSTSKASAISPDPDDTKIRAYYR